MPLTIPPISNASQISFTPAGNISATNVQAAIVELDLETVHLSGSETISGVKTFSNGISSAGNISIPASAWNAGMLVIGSNYFWVDTSTGLRAKSSAPTSAGDGALIGPYTASTLGFTPTGNIAASNVQSAIAELDSKAVHTSGNESLAGIKTFTDTTAATSATTGAVKIGGGLGVAGAIYSTTAKFTGGANSISTATGALVVTGGVGVGNNLYVGGNLNIAGTPTGLKSNTPTLITRRVASQNFSSGFFTTILWDTSVNDSGSGLNTSTGTYTVPTGQGGIYFCTARITFSPGSACNRLLLEVVVNGNNTRLFDVEVSGDTLTCASGSTALVLSAGDSVSVTLYQLNSVSATRATNTVRANHTEWSMFKLSTN